MHLSVERLSSELVGELLRFSFCKVLLGSYEGLVANYSSQVFAKYFETLWGSLGRELFRSDFHRSTFGALGGLGIIFSARNFDVCF